MPKKTKARPPTEEEIFTAEYMQALNEKFKVRGQLYALTNQLEELLARNERLADAIQEKEAPPTPKPPPPPKAPQPALRQVVLSPPTKRPSPTKTIETQTVQPEPPPLFAESPIKGLAPIIPPARQPVATPVPSVASEKPVEVDEGIYLDANDDDVVVVVKHEPPTIATNNGDLEEELSRLRRRFDEITFYAIVIIFALFAIMLAKELRLFFMPKTPPDESPSSQSHRTLLEMRRAAAEGDGVAGIDEVPLRVKLESSPRSPRPPPAGAGSLENAKITLHPAPPCDQPVMEVKCGEMPDVIQLKYDCDDCNRVLNLIGN